MPARDPDFFRFPSVFVGLGFSLVSPRKSGSDVLKRCSYDSASTILMYRNQEEQVDNECLEVEGSFYNFWHLAAVILIL